MTAGATFLHSPNSGPAPGTSAAPPPPAAPKLPSPARRDRTGAGPGAERGGKGGGCGEEARNLCIVYFKKQRCWRGGRLRCRRPRPLREGGRDGWTDGGTEGGGPGRGTAAAGCHLGARRQLFQRGEFGSRWPFGVGVSPSIPPHAPSPALSGGRARPGRGAAAGGAGAPGAAEPGWGCPPRRSRESGPGEGEGGRKGRGVVLTFE